MATADLFLRVVVALTSILLASHDNLVRHTQKEVLILCGYSVTDEARTVEEALKKFKEADFDFVVLDFHPEEFDVIKAIKEIQAVNNDVMIIVNSSWCSHSQTIEAMQLGIKDWVPNLFPHNPTRFMTTVDLLIGDAQRIKIQERILAQQSENGFFKHLRKSNIYGL
ncbi:MAG: response regulator [Defluviitaleaceae bacterium]|nr:response regulator [Defluviitaleaceae bacterium]